MQKTQGNANSRVKKGDERLYKYELEFLDLAIISAIWIRSTKDRKIRCLKDIRSKTNGRKGVKVKIWTWVSSQNNKKYWKY